MSILRNRLLFRLSVPALVMLVFGLLVTAILFVELRHQQHERMETDFRQRSNIRYDVLIDGMDKAVNALVSVNQLFAVNDVVTRAQFHKFTQPLLNNYPYIQSLGFQRLIPAAERSAYEARMRGRYPGFAISEWKNGLRVPAGIRNGYRVIDYLEPLAGNEAAFGLDTAATPYQDNALRRALETGQPSSTKMFRLAQEKGKQLGFVVMIPVYRPDAIVDDVASRQKFVVGYTTAAFRAGDLVEQMLAAGGFLSFPHIQMSVYADSSPSESTLVFRYGSAVHATPSASLLPHWIFYDHPDTYSRSFDVAGNLWHMQVSAQRVPFTAHHSELLLLPIVGMVFSLLAAAYLQTLASRSQRIQQLVDERTAEARRANQLLIEDIAARERAEQALRLRERAIEASANAIIITSAMPPHYPIEYVNPAFERMTGYKAEEIVGCSMRVLGGKDLDQPGVAEFKAATMEQREGHAVIRCYRKDGTMFWNDLYVAPVKDAAGAVTHFVAAQYDITETKSYQAELEFQATHDSLTGLPNRNLLRDRLRQAIAYAGRYNCPVWAVFVDLDRFKFVNDTLGHPAGDVLLKTVSERLQAVLRATDTVARLGGDEFMLLLPERADENLSTGVIQRVMDAIAQPLTIEGHEFVLTCSIGIAVYPTDGNEPEILMQRADIAMYRAKEVGRNNFQFYTPLMNQGALDRLRLEGELRNALERDEFFLVYQPQVDLRSGRIVGMEALIRWQHPELGLVSPVRFIGLAEETGLIVPIGSWVVSTACAQNKAWQRAGFGDLRIAVNLSARQFAQPSLVASIAAVLAETGLAARHLEIELTESLVMTDVERAIGVLRDLKSLGVQLSIDDFGTGYSSLSYLKRFPIDVLKIDQSFVRDITLDPDDAAIVTSIISLAHNLRLQVIAEGVETEEQLAYLWHHGCDEMQGYYFSRPVPAAEFERLLQQGKCLPPEAGRSELRTETESGGR